MGADYPVWTIPAPVYDANAPFSVEARPYQPATDLAFSAMVIDSGQVDLELFSVQRAYTDGIEALRALAGMLANTRPRTVVRVAGVVYTVVFNPIDGRKNFNDILGVSCGLSAIATTRC